MTGVTEITFSGNAERKFLVPSKAEMRLLPRPGQPHSDVLPHLVATQAPPDVQPLSPGTMLVTVHYVRKPAQ